MITPNEPLISVAGLSKRYGERTVLDGVNLTIAPQRDRGLDRAQRRRQVDAACVRSTD